MAADDKTEKATPKKRRDQRKEGNVAVSKDVVSVASLLGCFFLLQLLFPTIYKALRKGMMFQLSSIAEISELSMGNLQNIGMKSIETLVICIIPFGIISMLLSIIATGVQTRFLFTMKAARFKMSNLNPLNGFKNLFSGKNVVEILKAIFKVIILVVVMEGVLADDLVKFAQMMDMSPTVASAYTLKMVMSLTIRIVIVFVVIAGGDLLYQRWSYEKKIRMSKQEVKEEYKMLEGDPKVKGKIRSKQQAMGRQRMMQAVADADVIIRNPTHFAVALKYDIDHDIAPILVAKGKDYMALRIVELGQENGVTIIENKPLARGIYASTGLDQEIPGEYYGVVAEILVEVFRLNKKMG